MLCGVARAGDEIWINEKLKENSTVVLPAKTYTISDSILMNSGNTLTGTNGTIIKLVSNAGWKAWKPLIQATNIQNIEISNLEINANSDGNPDTLHGKGYYNIIHAIDCNSIKVHECIFHDSLGDGLRTKTSTNIKFYNNLIYKMGHEGFYGIDSQNIEVYNNRITTRTNSALRLWNTEHVRFHDNVIDAQLDSLGGNAGIQIEDSAGRMEDIEICNNIIKQTWGSGIWLIAYKKGKSHNQEIYIHHNLFWQPAQTYNIDYAAGITGYGTNGNIIKNNVFDGARNSAFLVLSGGSGSVLQDNIITNTVEHTRISQAGTGYGIANRAGANFTVSGNCFWNNLNGNLYQISSSNDDLQNPKTHNTSSGWWWTGSVWTCTYVSPMELETIAPTSTKNTTDTDTHEITSIFDILDKEFSTTARIEQKKAIIPSKNWQKRGKYTEATLSIEGFKGISKIEGIEYINGSLKDNVIVNYETRNTALFGAGQDSELSYEENESNLTVHLKVKTSYFKKTVYKVTIRDKSISVPSIITESETETFTVTSKAPVQFPEIKDLRVKIAYYNNSYNPHAVVDLSDNPGIVKEEYIYNGSSATYYKFVGEKNSKQNGLEYVNYSRISSWKASDKQISGYGDKLYIAGKFHREELNITATTPYTTLEVTDFNITEIPDESGKILNPSLWSFVGTFTIFAISIYRNGKRVIPKW
ncbi:MAG: right-handed parallel beta-helix repeat-containing protein [Methanosarcina sp.]